MLLVRLIDKELGASEVELVNLLPVFVTYAHLPQRWLLVIVCFNAAEDWGFGGQERRVLTLSG